MWKSAILLAVTAHVIYAVATEGISTSKSIASGSSSSSSKSSSSSASSSSYSSSSSFSKISSSGSSSKSSSTSSASSQATIKNPGCKQNQCTRPNEVYDPCPAKCPFRTCGIDDRLVRCAAPPNVGDPDCPPPACRCADGYFRDDKGNCVEWDQCPQCTNPNEEYDACPAPCPPRRCDVDEALILCQVPPQLGDPDCQPGCRCSDNYARNDEGICIPKDQCPLTCNENEVFSDCTQAICRAQECSQKGQPIACAAVDESSCNKGCVCAQNYLRDPSGNCVPEDQCGVSAESCKGDPNAKPGCGVNCGRLCSNYKDASSVSCIQVCYEDGCDCKENYVLDTNTGKCVLPDQCTPTCKTNEVFSNCTQAICRAQDCSQKGQPVACAAVAEGYCNKGCVCAKNYLRDSNGNCVPEDQCDETAVSCKGDPNAKPGCGVNCGRLCSNYKSEDVACILICYEDGCDCKENYVLDTNTGKCVLPDQCTPTCGQDEVFSSCANGGCGRTNCTQLNEPQLCVDPIKCEGGCLCRDGYLRAANGTCIPQNQCEQAGSCNGDPNAKPGCGVNCGRLCSNYQRGDVVCPAICYLNACDCKENYVFDSNIGKCVLPEECSPVQNQCNKPNEEYEECPDCSPGTCESIGKTYNCPLQTGDSSECTGECRCKPGYYRNKIGDCITKEQCLQCNGTNEYFSCGSACDNVCATLDQQNKTNCPIINIQCNKKCYCEDGYARDDNNICVPIDQCPVQNQCNKPNEEYQKCPDCSPGTCESIGKTYNCPLQPADSSKCTGECRCKAGYYLNKIGECITEEQCLQCNGTNEYFSCGPECDNVCATLDQQSKTNCPIINIQCNKKCYCEDGYARDGNNICVPIDQCPAGCKENERYVECPDAECVPQTCADAGFPVACPRFANGRCPSKPACICNSGYLKNSEGVCVPQNECPTCGGDPNARPGCGVNCGRLCSNYQNSDEVACPAICNLNGCDCIEGYVLDTNTGKCVLPEQCTSPCGQNEVYSNCVNGGCDKRNCSQIKDPKICIHPLKCEGGCVCQNGYLRDSKGVCVPQNQCEEICPDGETFSDCPPVYSRGCNSELCPQSRDDPAVCPTTRQCGEPRCICSYLRKRNRETGQCVLASDCPPFPCNGQNEVYDSCPPSCPGQNCSDYLNNSTCPTLFRIGIVVPCKPACRCVENTYRNSKGVCVSGAECELQCNGTNEYFSCGPECDNVCATLDKQSRTNCPIINKKCNKKCYCEDGYARDGNNICVPIDQCPAACKENERYVECPDAECVPQTCADAGFPVACPSFANGRCPSKPACICNSGYLKNSEGVCVPQNECPTCGGDPNARPGCGVNCGRLCSNYQSSDEGACSDICNLNGCDCIEGYVLDTNTGKCVLPEQCTSPCGQNEVYSNCVNGGCDKRNCSQIKDPKICIDPLNCEGGCVCQDGYLRDSNEICVPQNQCEAISNDPSIATTYGADDNQLSDLEQGNTAFSGNFLYQVLSSKPGENLIMSPFSVLIPLAELALYANGLSLTELLKVFNLQNKDQVRSTFPNLITMLDSEQNNTLDLGARVYVNQDYQLTKDFEDDTALFNATADTINVNDPAGAAAKINDWVSDITRGKITDLVSPDVITSLTRLILANAIYFKGTWKTQFDPKNTIDQDFYVTKNDTSQVKMMNLKDKFNYTEISDLDAKVLQLPYVGGDMSLIAILPNQIDGLVSLVEKLRDESVFNNAINSLSLETVTVSLPKMDISTTIDLKKILQELNVTGIFDQSDSGLQGIITKNETLYVTDAIEKAAFTADEQGSEASAANAVIIGTRSLPLPRPEEYIFNADHPFVFAILYKQLVLFIGTFVK